MIATNAKFYELFGAEDKILNTCDVCRGDPAAETSIGSSLLECGLNCLTNY